MANAGPFYFAWVDPTETTFTSSHYRCDEFIFSAKRTLAEGQKPLLELEIQNPHVGLLSTGRKLWAWFAWDRNYFTGSGGIEPLFFGRIVGAPVAINKETLTLQLIASPADYKQRVQLIAEGLKTLPYWDPVFIDVGKRDDPDTILETRAAFWDVDPITHAVTKVSIVEGPDGSVNVTDHFYDSLDITVSQPPATAILMDASVSWTQAYRGKLSTLASTTNAFGADGIVSGWPKPNQSIGGGYFVDDSSSIPSAGNDPEMENFSWSWQNTEKHHENGDTMSASISASWPKGYLPGRGPIIISMTQQVGIVDPYTVDQDGDPAPLNIPASINIQSAYPIRGSVSSSMTLRYEAARPRTERVKFLIRADMQEIIVDPTLDQDSEVLTISGVDVGIPIIDLRNWTSIAGTFCPVGTVIFPDNPDLPGSQSAQIAVGAGVAGTVEPNFSDVPGVTTVDGGVTWASLGVATPTTNAVDWQADTNVPTGTIILPKRPDFETIAQLQAPGLAQTPQHRDPAVSEGQIIRFADGTYNIVDVGGPISGASFFNLGTTLPTGSTYYIAIQGGRTSARYHLPPFGANTAINATTTDNGVIWASIGSGDIPIGGVPGMTPSASYFATDRGRLSVEYLALRVRSRLLWRGRCADVSFDTQFAEGVNFTTRKMATVTDPRLPGGVAVGKVKSAELTVSDGTASCHVTIGCTLGKANEVVAVTGTPVYVDSYVDGYQVYDGQYVLLPNGSDLAYAPPVYTANDDGLTFPLDNEQVVLSAGMHGDPDAQFDAVRAAIETKIKDDMINSILSSFGTFDLTPNQLQQNNITPDPVSAAVNQHPVYYELVLKPLTGTFHEVYTIKFSKLTMGKGIDLGAA